MREVLFRGKRLDNGEWETGSLVIVRMDCHDAQYYIADKMTGYHTPVDPAAVGQYTGLKDKNGKLIFEGDIIRYNTYDDFGCHSVVRFGEYEQDGSGGEYSPRDCVGWYVEVDNFTCPDWCDDDPEYFRHYMWQQNILEVLGTCEVIGNIHDNPELLKGDKGNGVTVRGVTDNNVGRKWISVEERLPENFISVLGYMTDAGEFPPVRECYTVGNAFFFPALGDVHPVSHWCEMPEPPKGE